MYAPMNMQETTTAQSVAGNDIGNVVWLKLCIYIRLTFHYAQNRKYIFKQNLPLVPVSFYILQLRQIESS